MSARFHEHKIRSILFSQKSQLLTVNWNISYLLSIYIQNYLHPASLVFSLNLSWKNALDIIINLQTLHQSFLTTLYHWHVMYIYIYIYIYISRSRSRRSFDRSFFVWSELITSQFDDSDRCSKHIEHYDANVNSILSIRWKSLSHSVQHRLTGWIMNFPYSRWLSHFQVDSHDMFISCMILESFFPVNCVVKLNVIRSTTLWPKHIVLQKYFDHGWFFLFWNEFPFIILWVLLFKFMTDDEQIIHKLFTISVTGYKNRIHHQNFITNTCHIKFDQL